MSSMTEEERNELIDLVAQAVIDKMEERDRVNNLANMVVARVLQLQYEEANLGVEQVADKSLLTK